MTNRLTTPRRRWSEMTWPEIAESDSARWIAVLPIAASEQHGPHLPLGADSLICDLYLEQVQALLPTALPASFLPVQEIGLSTEHIGFPGTLTLSPATYIALLTEIGESLARCGVRKLLIVSSHGGNVEAMDIVARVLREKHRMLVVTTTWHRMGYPDGLFDPAEEEHGIHAGDIETSLLLAGCAALVRMEKAENAIPSTIRMAETCKWLSASRPAAFAWLMQDLHPSGAAGDALHASAEKGRGALEHGARAFIELLWDIDRFDLAQLAAGPLPPDAASR